ncbi:MAG: hypothetical protein HIU81_13265 [Acidobacteria bacterium]|nr:hypothetical protein [Acidobacteriota bacterium]
MVNFFTSDEYCLDLMKALDYCTNMLSEPLTAGSRARIFAATLGPSIKLWLDARSILVNKTETLWHCAIAVGMETTGRPTQLQILQALQYAIGVLPRTEKTTR